MLLTNLTSNSLFHSVRIFRESSRIKIIQKQLMCKNFPEIDAYFCHHKTEAGFEPLNPEGARQSYAPYQLPLGHGSS